MPKMKTRRAAAKRFKITGTGKFTYAQANKRHILEKKSPGHKRNLRKIEIISIADQKNVEKMLPYAN